MSDKARHSHKRGSPNPVKIQSNLTCLSANIEKTRHFHKRLSENTLNLHANINPPKKLPDTSCTAYAKNHTNIRKITRKSCDLRGAGTKVNGETRDFCEMRAILNEKTRHSHGRDSANPVKMHTKVTSSSEKHVNMHTKKSDALTQAGCGLRPKAYRTKRTLGLGPHREKVRRASKAKANN